MEVWKQREGLDAVIVNPGIVLGRVQLKYLNDTKRLEMVYPGTNAFVNIQM